MKRRRMTLDDHKACAAALIAAHGAFREVSYKIKGGAKYIDAAHRIDGKIFLLISSMQARLYDELSQADYPDEDFAEIYFPRKARADV